MSKMPKIHVLLLHLIRHTFFVQVVSQELLFSRGRQNSALIAVGYT